MKVTAQADAPVSLNNISLTPIAGKGGSVQGKMMTLERNYKMVPWRKTFILFLIEARGLQAGYHNVNQMLGFSSPIWNFPSLRQLAIPTL